MHAVLSTWRATEFYFLIKLFTLTRNVLGLFPFCNAALAACLFLQPLQENARYFLCVAVAVSAPNLVLARPLLWVKWAAGPLLLHLSPVQLKMCKQGSHFGWHFFKHYTKRSLHTLWPFSKRGGIWGATELVLQIHMANCMQHDSYIELCSFKIIAINASSSQIVFPSDIHTYVRWLIWPDIWTSKLIIRK